MPQQNTFYSEEAQEIMGRMPSRLVRWGLACIFFIFLIISGICFFIRYPQTISGRVVIATEPSGVPVPISKGERVDSEQVFGLVAVSSHNMGRLHAGQPVRIRLHAYPQAEYGMLRGEVVRLSPIPEQIGQYQVFVLLPDGLRTSQGRELPLIPQMDGTAEIIISNPRLIERLVSPFAKLISNR